MTMSDRIAVFNHGRLEQLGSPAEIYERPRTAFVADFIGAANVLTAQEASGLFCGRLKGEGPVAIRPERIAVRYHQNGGPAEGTLRLNARLLDNVFLGNSNQIFVEALGGAGKRLMALSMDGEHRQPRAPGSPLWLDIAAKDILALDA